MNFKIAISSIVTQHQRVTLRTCRVSSVNNAGDPPNNAYYLPSRIKFGIHLVVWLVGFSWFLSHCSLLFINSVRQRCQAILIGIALTTFFDSQFSQLSKKRRNYYTDQVRRLINKVFRQVRWKFDINIYIFWIIYLDSDKTREIDVCSSSSVTVLISTQRPMPARVICLAFSG